MTSALLSALLLLSACRGPITAGPFIETGLPAGTGHDFEGAVGLEVARDWIAFAIGTRHPENGEDELIARVTLRFLIWGVR